MQALFLGQPAAWLRYHDLPGRAPACVYLHGLACAASSDFPALVAQPPLVGRRALLVDLLGFGFSDRPAGFSYAIEDHAATVAALLDHLGLTGCVVVGHSMGGSVAIALATLRPDLVGQLVVVEGNLAAGPEEGTNAEFSRTVSAQSEEVFVAAGYGEFLGAVRPAAPVFAGSMQVADPRAVHRTSVSLVSERRPSFGDQLRQASMPRAYVFGELTLQNEDMARRATALPTQGVPVRVVPKVDHGMGLMEPDAGPAAFAEALAAALDHNA